MDMDSINNLLSDDNLDNSLKRFLFKQIGRYSEFRSHGFKDHGPLLRNSKVILKEGTLVHGIGDFAFYKVKYVYNTGILMSSLLKSNDLMGTDYCADFYRVCMDKSLYDYNEEFCFDDGSTPFGNKYGNQDSLAFIVGYDDDTKELLDHDAYRAGTTEAEASRMFVQYLPIVDYALASAILYGVPSNMIYGIVVGDNLLNNKDTIRYLIKTFSHCYLSTRFGELIYDPTRKEIFTKEYIEARRKMFVLKNTKRKLIQEIAAYEKALEYEKQKYKELEDSIIVNCPENLLCNIFYDTPWYKDFDSVKRYIKFRKKEIENSYEEE